MTSERFCPRCGGRLFEDWESPHSNYAYCGTHGSVKKSQARVSSGKGDLVGRNSPSMNVYVDNSVQISRGERE